MKNVKLGRGSILNMLRKYWVFASEYRNLNKYDRDRKLAHLASNKSKCWWVKEFLTMYPNRILDRSRKNYEK